MKLDWNSSCGEVMDNFWNHTFQSTSRPISQSGLALARMSPRCPCKHPPHSIVAIQLKSSNLNSLKTVRCETELMSTLATSATLIVELFFIKFSPKKATEQHGLEVTFMLAHGITNTYFIGLPRCKNRRSFSLFSSY